MKILGCDPGLTGAIALLDTEDRSLVIHDMPVGSSSTTTGKTRNEMNEAVLVHLVRELEPDMALVEKVHAMPGNGSVSMFRFGETYGVLRGVLAGCGVPVDFVRPQEWQSIVKLPRGDDAAILRAAQVFPRYANYFARKKDHGRADAALIGYAKYLMMGGA